MSVFTYTRAELDALKKKDKKLTAAIDRIAMIRREVNHDLFSALTDSIVSQQISGKAAETVSNKLLGLCGEITPDRIHGADTQKGGMSMRKARYIKDAGGAVYGGVLNLSA